MRPEVWARVARQDHQSNPLPYLYAVRTVQSGFKILGLQLERLYATSNSGQKCAEVEAGHVAMSLRTIRVCSII